MAKRNKARCVLVVYTRQLMEMILFAISKNAHFLDGFQAGGSQPSSPVQVGLNQAHKQVGLNQAHQQVGLRYSQAGWTQPS